MEHSNQKRFPLVDRKKPIWRQIPFEFSALFMPVWNGLNLGARSSCIFVSSRVSLPSALYNFWYVHSSAIKFPCWSSSGHSLYLSNLRAVQIVVIWLTAPPSEYSLWLHADCSHLPQHAILRFVYKRNLECKWRFCLMDCRRPSIKRVCQVPLRFIGFSSTFFPTPKILTVKPFFNSCNYGVYFSPVFTH